MSKPFYKQTWFFGTTGLASLGIIIGSTLAFQNPPPAEDFADQYITTDAPPEYSANNNHLTALVDLNDETEVSDDNSNQLKSQNTLTIEDTFTPDNKVPKNNKTKNQLTVDKDLAESDRGIDAETKPLIIEEIQKPTEEIERNAAFDLYPRIGDKIGGTITRSELLDNKGITTEGDVNIIHFELHLIDGLGGKVYSEDGNQLNQEMKDALDQVGQGETIYFENIRGQVKSGAEVRLNPLRYVLLN